MRYIYAHSEEIKIYFENNTLIASRSIKRLSWTRITDLERVLYQWCVRCRGKNIESTIEIRRRALEFNEKLNGDPNFRASYGWMMNFKERCRIYQADIDDFRTPNRAAANIFKANFKELLKCEEYTLKNVYNVNYTGLTWRAVPELTWIF